MPGVGYYETDAGRWLARMWDCLRNRGPDGPLTLKGDVVCPLSRPIYRAHSLYQSPGGAF